MQTSKLRQFRPIDRRALDPVLQQHVRAGLPLESARQIRDRLQFFYASTDHKHQPAYRR